MRLILASASPRRAELLKAAGFTFDVRSTDVDERVLPGETPREYVRRLAIEKSAAALRKVAGERPAEAGRHNEPEAGFDRGTDVESRRTLSNVVVIGADTTVVVGDEILGKPADAAEAERMLRQLSGRTHVVMTGVSVRSLSSQLDAVDETVVVFRRLSDADVEWYLRSGDGAGKAGAYAIQGLASRFIPRIEGSYSNVVGLPLALVSELLDTIKSG